MGSRFRTNRKRRRQQTAFSCRQCVANCHQLVADRHRVVTNSWQGNLSHEEYSSLPLDPPFPCANPQLQCSSVPDLHIDDQVSAARDVVCEVTERVGGVAIVWRDIAEVVAVLDILPINIRLTGKRHWGIPHEGL